MADRALLQGAEAARALSIARAVGEALRDPAKVVRADLANGKAGVALLLDALEHAFPGEGWSEAADRHLDAAIDAVGDELVRPGLYWGYTGVAWVVETLRGGAQAHGSDDPNEEIDAAVLEALDRDPTILGFDLFEGLVGLGVYGLARMPRPAGRTIGEQVARSLGRLARRSPQGSSFFTPPERAGMFRRQHPDGLTLLGLAHGVAGAVAILARLHQSGIEAAQPVLADTARWLAAQRLPGGSRAIWPSIEAGAPSAACFCHGDPGMALALAAAADALDRPDWRVLAQEAARRVAALDRRETLVRDAGLCHGAAGLGHMLGRLHAATGEEAAADAARRWLTAAMDLHQPTGFGFPKALEADAWDDDPGLLEGATGAALALLTATRPDPGWGRWDRVLLLS